VFSACWSIEGGTTTSSNQVSFISYDIISKGYDEEAITQAFNPVFHSSEFVGSYVVTSSAGSRSASLIDRITTDDHCLVYSLA